jgi:hypothetical protein
LYRYREGEREGGERGERGERRRRERGWIYLHR